LRNRKYKSTQNSQSGKPLSTRLSATLSKAIALHQEGQFSVAKKLYEEVLAKSPQSFDALHLLGVLEHQSVDADRKLTHL
jgi:tetratricopeptide (TPR) repeat protein